MTDELFDILAPPDFQPTGVTKTPAQAIADLDWVGSFCLWLYTPGDEPALIYQERTLTGAWAPGKLDCAAAGHYTSGEQGLDGLREAREELGIDIPAENCRFVRRRINVAIDALGRERRSVSNLYIARYDGAITDMKLQPEELEGIVAVPIRQLLSLFDGKVSSLDAGGYKPDGTRFIYTITSDSFVPNYDDLHADMVRYVAGQLLPDYSAKS